MKSKAKPHKPTQAPLGIQHILVTTDFSDESSQALPFARTLADGFGARLTLIHVVEKFPIDALLGRELTKETTKQVMELARFRLMSMAEDFRARCDIKADIVVRFGKPFEEIVRCAKDLDASMIVVATHGYTGIKHAYLGSVAERVVRHAHCPVLVVRNAKR